MSIPEPGKSTLRLPRIFSDHMVLQQRKPIHVWGWAPPSSVVTVALGESGAATAEATTDGAGLWALELPAQAANADPQHLTVKDKKTRDGKDTNNPALEALVGANNPRLIDQALDRHRFTSNLLLLMMSRYLLTDCL